MTQLTLSKAAGEVHDFKPNFVKQQTGFEPGEGEGH